MVVTRNVMDKMFDRAWGVAGRLARATGLRRAIPQFVCGYNQRHVYLGDNRMAVRANWGGWVVVPTFNIDVALGVIRDGAIEPWTTRLVQELLRPGGSYLNAGANFGYYVSLGGSLVGHGGTVIGVEPNPHILPYLFHTVLWAGLTGNARIYRRALADAEGETYSFQFDPQFLGGGSAREIWSGGQGEKANLTFAEALWAGDRLDDQFGPDGRWLYGKGRYVPFSVTTTTIDKLCEDIAEPTLIHLDIEGGEALALKGAMKTIARSPGIRLITEWGAGHYINGSGASRSAFEEFWAFAADQGFRVRRLEPRIAPNGGIYLSHILDFAHMTTAAEHGDYVWVRASSDPWGG